MKDPNDRVPARLVQEVADRAPVPPAWADVLARLAPEPSSVPRIARRRPWLLAATAGGVAAAAALGVVVYQRAGDGSGGASVGQTVQMTIASTSGPSVAATSAPATTTADESSSTVATSDPLFAPSWVPEGFSVAEASTSHGIPPNLLRHISAETWISRGDDGQIDGIVQLTAYERTERPNELPPAPTGITVHGEVAQLTGGTDADGGSGISWDEDGLTLVVTSWGPDAASIAEQSVVSTSVGITLPAGVLADSFVRTATEPNSTLEGARSSYVQWATQDGETTLGLSAQPNIDSETDDTLGSTPGAKRMSVGSHVVWLRTTGDDGINAIWIDGDYILSAGGNVDWAILHDFVSSVGRTSRPAFDALMLEASAVNQAVTERDRAVFADGLEVSMHSDADIEVPETSSFGPRAFCLTGDRTFCSGEVTPSTEGGLLTALTSTRTVNGTRELLVWLGAGRTVTRIYDATTNADLEFGTAAGTVGSFARAPAPPDVISVVVEYQVDGRAYPDRLRVNSLDLPDRLADVTSPNPQGG